MAVSLQGDPVHGEIIETNQGGGTYSVLLYPAGTVTARTLLATEFLIITDILFFSTAGGTFDFVMNTAVAGRHIVKGNLDAKSGVMHHFEVPITCPVGITPALIVAAGAVDLVMTGYICKA